MKGKCKRILSFMLSLIMVLGLFPNIVPVLEVSAATLLKDNYTDWEVTISVDDWNDATFHSAHLSPIPTGKNSTASWKAKSGTIYGQYQTNGNYNSAGTTTYNNCISSADDFNIYRSFKLNEYDLVRAAKGDFSLYASGTFWHRNDRQATYKVYVDVYNSAGTRIGGTSDSVTLAAWFTGAKSQDVRIAYWDLEGDVAKNAAKIDVGYVYDPTEGGDFGTDLSYPAVALQDEAAAKLTTGPVFVSAAAVNGIIEPGGYSQV